MFLLIAVLHLINELFFNVVVDFDDVKPDMGRDCELFIVNGFIIDLAKSSKDLR